MVAVAPEEPARALSGGMYVPVSRKDLMLEVRRSEEAEGERRMIGSGRERFLREETRGPLLLSVVDDTVEAEMVEGALGRGRLRPRNISAVLRIYEKS